MKEYKCRACFDTGWVEGNSMGAPDTICPNGCLQKKYTDQGYADGYVDGRNAGMLTAGRISERKYKINLDRAVRILYPDTVSLIETLEEKYQKMYIDQLRLRINDALDFALQPVKQDEQ